MAELGSGWAEKARRPYDANDFELCLGTAQRLSDVLAMKWTDVEALKETLPDGTEISVPGIHVLQSKTGWRGWIPVSDTLAAYLATLDRSHTTIVADPRGRPVDRYQAQRLLAAVRPNYGGEAFTFHGLRYNAT